MLTSKNHALLEDKEKVSFRTIIISLYSSCSLSNEIWGAYDDPENMNAEFVRKYKS